MERLPRRRSCLPKRDEPIVRVRVPACVDRWLFDRRGGQFRRLVGLTCHFAPASPAAYRRYLPAPLEMPPCPIVKVFLIDYLEVSPWPFAPYREWSVLLGARHDGVVGWFPVTMPVTSWIARQGGRHLGFPKGIADRITLLDRENEVTGRIVAHGIDMVMEFQAGPVPSVGPEELRLLRHEHVVPEPLIVLKPVGLGPAVKHVVFADVLTPSWEVRRGTVRIHGDAGGLIPQGVPLAGSVHAFAGGMNLRVAGP